MARFKSTLDGIVSFTAAEEAEWDIIEANAQAHQINEAKQDARNKRNKLLDESDWTQLPDALAITNDWTTYRQALRDVPQQTGFPNDITWPTEPS